MTPQQTVKELDRYIVGQLSAKRAVAVALRNRHRRQQLSATDRAEVTPKNILMIGPTGVGKTEVARRMAKLIDAPFLKVEATKFTEVGYVGRDAESIVRDLMDVCVSTVQDERTAAIKQDAEARATEKLLNYMLNPIRAGATAEAVVAKPRSELATRRQRKRMMEMLAAGQIDERMVDIELEPDETYAPVMEFVGGMSAEDVADAMQDFVAAVSPGRKRTRNVSVREARKILTQEETNKLIDWDSVIEEATERVEQRGIVFIDELDKIVSKGTESQMGAEVSREGVQRDLLPIVEGSTVQTRYGPVKTDHILFIAAGSFHHAKPSDLIPELQGRFPLRVELQQLSTEDFCRILTEPENALIRQYQLLLATEDVTLEFTSEGVDEIARTATLMNERTENIGARRLQTIVEKVLDRTSFEAPEIAGTTVVVDRAFVQGELGDTIKNEDLSKYIL
jgi:ATP-dependent HslUV protease ATP-binding subunit HslU